MTLTEVQLVDDVVLYRRLDARDHVPTDVRAARPSDADWAKLRRALDTAGIWHWPRRWPRVHDGYDGEFAIGVLWDSCTTVSVGALGVAPEVEAVLEEVRRLVGNGPRHAQQPVATLRSPALPPPYPLDVPFGTDHACAVRLP